MSKASERYYSKREKYLDMRMSDYSKRSKLSGLKAVALMFPILMLFYLVLYLKEIGLDYQTYFSNYDNAISVWSVGFDYFKTIMNTLDSITSVMGKILEFVIDSVDAIITFITDRINSFTGILSKSWFENVARWLQDALTINIF